MYVHCSNQRQGGAWTLSVSDGEIKGRVALDAVQTKMVWGGWRSTLSKPKKKGRVALDAVRTDCGKGEGGA